MHSICAMPDAMCWLGPRGCGTGPAAASAFGCQSKSSCFRCRGSWDLVVVPGSTRGRSGMRDLKPTGDGGFVKL